MPALWENLRNWSRPQTPLETQAQGNSFGQELRFTYSDGEREWQGERRPEHGGGVKEKDKIILIQMIYLNFLLTFYWIFFQNQISFKFIQLVNCLSKV